MSMAEPIVIAHRGASGYLPEHSLEAKAMAHAMGADYIEQDVVLTRDGVPIVLHDIYLEPTTDVEQRFPDRAREDGHFYALDFTLSEIRQLRLHERSYRDSSGGEVAYYPRRFPLGNGDFRLPTLAEEIALIAGLDRSRARTTGLYIELKAPRWHQARGYDIGATVLEVLEATGYAEKSSQVFLQCFDDQTLQDLRDKTTLPMIQLIGDNSWGEDGGVDYDAMRSPEGIAGVAYYPTCKIRKPRQPDRASPPTRRIAEKSWLHGPFMNWPVSPVLPSISAPMPPSSSASCTDRVMPMPASICWPRPWCWSAW